ncbi:protein FAR1-RELATED SEQUENCE 5-like [Macadamia integrifolia]|uniref:protein FAR1-RELATED SEQUENCE 5-like n=1 Tax=Macadamia integrifolia TaxID=60698 RepID=UPI001C50262B|nr:protein FAR1-RELATED SEQUENCE 5-like [Macadamia integrifolia]
MEKVELGGNVEINLQVRIIFNSENEAYDFYNSYGGILGFSIRRDFAHKSHKHKAVITCRRFVCNKAGFWREDKRDIHTKKPRAETRIECPARMGIYLMENGYYECHDFLEKHNHPLYISGTTHFICSQRKSSEIHSYEMDLADDSGINPKAIFELMGRQASGTENLGYTCQDQKNYLRIKRQNSLSYGEAGSLLRYFEDQSRNNPSFTYSMQLDSDEQITNIFWADPKMRIDYA